MASENDQESNSSLRTAFEAAEALRRALEETYDCNCESYQSKVRAAITAHQECKKLVQDLALFSPNEIFEDISSSELRYLLIDFYLAELVIKIQGIDRKETLTQAQKCYKLFLTLCDSYDILSKPDRDAFESLSQATSASALTHIPKDPAAKRQSKISRFRQEKELKNKLEYLSKNPNREFDEDVIRELYTTSINFSILQSLAALESIVLEFDILKMAPPPKQEPQPEDDGAHDDRQRSAKSDGYNEKLDNVLSLTNKSGPLLSADGKPLRPFTLLDNRETIKQGVFRSGHNLPTMTIDEYLDEERRRGNIIEGGGEKSGLQPEPDEDNYEKADAATMKAREWDEFTEANPRGSGNTFNRG
ncbi:TAP42-like protein [Peziza echinospora]|nr:TAP42-like protein [Peziza echinospora]